MFGMIIKLLESFIHILNGLIVFIVKDFDVILRLFPLIKKKKISD